MGQVEAEGRTLEEALLRAARELGAAPNSLGYEVLERKGGLLGILGRKAVRVRAWLRQEGPGEFRVFLGKLLGLAGLDCEVARVAMQGELLLAELQGPDSGLLLRRDGELLEALGYMTERALNRKREQNLRVLLDVGGFRARREQELREKALQAAKEAMRSGSAALGPLSARDRRTVHLFLKERPGLSTRSVGQGPLRRVLITREAPAAHPGDEYPPQ